MIIKIYNVIMTKTYDVSELRINLCKFLFLFENSEKIFSII